MAPTPQTILAYQCHGPITLLTPASHGTAAVNDGGTPTDPTDDTIDYTPDADYNGPDSFTYEICDVDADCDPATVDVTVTQVDDLPVALDDSATTPEDTAAATGGSDLDLGLDSGEFDTTGLDALSVGGAEESLDGTMDTAELVAAVDAVGGEVDEALDLDLDLGGHGSPGPRGGR